MRALRHFPAGLALLTIVAASGCRRGPADSPPPGSGGTPGGAVADDLKGVAKQTEKAAKDIGHATVDLADKAGQHLEHLGDHAGADSKDAWITTKVKSALTAEGIDPLHVHVDTSQQVVTLSGTVPTAARKEKALGAARTVTDVIQVKDHLFVQPDSH